jgi:hypothetical protein
MGAELNAVRRTLAVAVALAALTALPAAAQWVWKDSNGRTVYSDRSPPPDVKPSQIMRQPSNPVLGPAPSQAASPSDASKAPAEKAQAASGPKTVAEREMEFRKRQQERADSERKAQEEQQKSAAKATECERARGYLKGLEDGQRVVRTDASGNREFLDDSQRGAEIERTRKMVQSLCS